MDEILINDQLFGNGLQFRIHTANGEQGVLCVHHPADRQQQQNAQDHGEGEAGEARLLLLVLRQAVDKDADENDVVDAQHDFQHREREQGDPCLGLCDPFHERNPWRRERDDGQL